MSVERPEWWFEPECDFDSYGELTEKEIELMAQEYEIQQEEWFPDYEKSIKDFMSDKNKELDFRRFLKEERRKNELFDTK